MSSFASSTGDLYFASDVPSVDFLDMFLDDLEEVPDEADGMELRGPPTKNRISPGTRSQDIKQCKIEETDDCPLRDDVTTETPTSERRSSSRRVTGKRRRTARTAEERAQRDRSGSDTVGG